MRCDILTLFPEMVAPFFQSSMLKRALDRGVISVGVHSLRSFATDKHKCTDDSPYGGGPGMVLKPEPIFAAIEAIGNPNEEMRIILTSPQGRLFNQSMAQAFSRDSRRLLFICGHYEGIDERVRDGLPVEEVSIGDYVLTGGELAALVMIDAAARWVPGVLGTAASLREESFSSSLLEYPQYTRPAEFRGMSVPPVLINGNHKAIEEWRSRQAYLNTLKKRPDLLEGEDVITTG